MNKAFNNDQYFEIHMADECLNYSLRLLKTYFEQFKKALVYFAGNGQLVGASEETEIYKIIYKNNLENINRVILDIQEFVNKLDGYYKSMRIENDE